MKRLILLALCIFQLFTLKAQCPKSTTRIYSITNAAFSGPNSGTNYLTYYDYATSEFDTVLSFVSTVTGAFYTAIDPFNGRYFLLGKVDTTKAGSEVLIFDLNNETMTRTYTNFTESEFGQIEYDIFTNKLLFRSVSDLFKSYDIATKKLDTLFTLHKGGIVWGKTNVYNGFKQQYSFLEPESGSGCHFVTVDVINNIISRNDNVDCSTNALTFDLITEKYYAQSKEYGHEIVSIDPVDGSTKHVADFAEANSYLDEQDAVFDSRAGLYLFPYFTASQKSKLAVVDITKGQVINILDYRITANLEKLYGVYDAIIKLKDDNSTLIATYGKSYQWYLDGQQIQGANEQLYKPSIKGVYKAEVTFLCDRKSFSNEIAYVSSGITNNAENSVKIYGNPFHDQTVLKFNNPNKESYTLVLLNMVGQTARTYDNIISEKLIINRNELTSGIYYYKLFKDKDIITKGKLVVE